MELEADVLQTLLTAIVVLFIGRFLNGRVGFLRTYNIPVPVVGGIAFAGLTMLLFKQFDVSVSFDMALRTPMMLVFFTTVGLGANIRLLAAGGPKILLFLGVATVFLVVQNGVGTLAAISVDLHPLIGLLSGSITLSGGHGTGAAYAQRFSDVQNLQGVMELAMACATFGLVIGGIIGGPVAQRLISRHRLRSAEEAADAAAQSVKPSRLPVDAQSLIETLFLILLCMFGGGLLADLFAGSAFTLPIFIWSLLLGVAARNLCELTGVYRIKEATVDMLGTVSLYLFLAMALMSLRLWELLSLAGPISLILAVHTLTMAVFAYYVTFRLMGGSYDAAILSGGHCGFGMGATPTAVANMEALVSRHGPSPQAFLIIPMVGAFFIDVTNALVIQGFLALPLFGF